MYVPMYRSNSTLHQLNHVPPLRRPRYSPGPIIDAPIMLVLVVLVDGDVHDGWAQTHHHALLERRHVHPNGRICCCRRAKQ